MKRYDQATHHDFRGAATAVLFTLTGMLGLVVATVLMQPMF